MAPFKRIVDLKYGNLDHWGEWNYFTYLLFQENTVAKEVKAKIDHWAESQSEDRMEFFKEVYYQPLSQIHFQYNRKNIEPAFKGKYISIFIAVAIIILIIACINFMNLSTARSTKRAREVGLRKVVGANRWKLVKQFIGESIFLAFIACIFALIIVELLLPVFNNLSGKSLYVNYSEMGFIFSVIGLVIITGVISGCYPAFVLSAFRPVMVLKGIPLVSALIKGRSKGGLRNILVIFQFTISIALIFCTIIIYRQMSFIQNEDLGLNKDQILNILLRSKNLSEKASDKKNEFLKIPGVLSASANSYFPSNLNWNQSTWWKGQQEDERTNMWIIGVDKDFTETLQIEMIEGKDLAKYFKATDKLAYILNESAVKQIGWSTAMGREFSIYGQQDPGIVVGVAKDFHFRSLHHEIAPCAMVVFEGGSQISLRINSENLSNTMDLIKNTWKKLAPNLIFEYYFLDEDFDKLYKSETTASQVIGYFTVLSIFIACLGLFGLASFIADQRTKEIGIRKVNGASISSIIMLLSKDFTKWIVVAFIIACPIAWYTMNKWLQDFAYRININWWIFIASGALALAIALFTVGYQAIKVAKANPVESLRYE